MADSTDQHKTSITLLEKIGRLPRDEASWYRFEKIYSPWIAYYFRKKGLQETDTLDLTQMVFSKFIQQASSFHYDPAMSFRGYFLKIMQTVFVDWAQKRNCVSGLVQVDEFSKFFEVQANQISFPDQETEFDLEIYEEARCLVQNCVESRTWEAFECLAIKGMSGEEAATYLNMKRGSVFAAKCKVQRLIRIEVEKRLAQMDQSLNQ